MVGRPATLFVRLQHCSAAPNIVLLALNIVQRRQTLLFLAKPWKRRRESVQGQQDIEESRRRWKYEETGQNTPANSGNPPAADKPRNFMGGYAGVERDSLRAPQ